MLINLYIGCSKWYRAIQNDSFYTSTSFGHSLYTLVVFVLNFCRSPGLARRRRWIRRYKKMISHFNGWSCRRSWRLNKLGLNILRYLSMVFIEIVYYSTNTSNVRLQYTMYSKRSANIFGHIRRFSDQLFSCLLQFQNGKE